MRVLQEDLRERLVELLQEGFMLQAEDVQFSIPPDRKFGDLSTTIPFVLAKRLKDKPFLIGKRIIEAIEGEFDLFESIQLAGGGFLNFTFKKNFLFPYLMENRDRKLQAPPDKVIVEHTSINPNKSAHIGHLRNSCLGDTLVGSLRYLGHPVEVQNYIDDTGIQVADVVWAILYLEKKSIRDLDQVDNLASYLWELYSRASKMFADDPQLAEERKEVHRKIEDKIDPEYTMSDYVSRQVLHDHVRVMDLIGIRYDLMVRERDIIELDYFKKAEEVMKRDGVMYLSQDPEKEGCWVIKYDRENIEKVVIRSNGTVTYIGKDIAYTFWKVGLFANDFYYQEFHQYEDGHKVFMTDFQAGDHGMAYGDAATVYNVIDTRQSYLQNIISQVLESMGKHGSKRRFIHFSYEMVALTPRCVKELGLPLAPEDEKKAYVEVSGRKGIAVKADDLIDILTEKSSEEVKVRNPQMPEEQIKQIARKIAIGAVRYFMIKFSSTSVIAFDFKEALAFEGDTGPYLQYALVRINSILRRMEEQGVPVDVTGADLDLTVLPPDGKELSVTYELLLQLSLIDVQVELALQNSELSTIANYTYSLCQKFNHYYHLFPILSEKDPALKKLRIGTVLLVKDRLLKLFNIMGIPVPEKM
jgi:arginyl-tRNA synthetase